MKKLVTILLLMLFSSTSAYALFEPEDDPFWIERTNANIGIVPEEITMSSEIQHGYYEVNLDKWFLKEENARWFNMVLRRVKIFQRTYESEVRTYVALGAEVLAQPHPQYRAYKFRDIEYFFYYNGNKRFIVRDERTRDKTSFFFNNVENHIQIWGGNVRMVIEGLTGYVIIPNGKVYDFNPGVGLQSLENKGDIWSITVIPKDAWALVSEARNYIGSNHALTVNGKTYNNDCSGFVSALYMKYGIDLIEGIEQVSNRSGYNLTAIIFDAQDYNGTLITVKEPLPGDLVIFSNTYDRNNNGVWDDYLSHIGIVEAVDEKGTVTFIHHLNATVGVRRDILNLYDPDDPILNSVIRGKQRGDPVHFRYLSGQLWESFARVFH